MTGIFASLMRLKFLFLRICADKDVAFSDPINCILISNIGDLLRNDFHIARVYVTFVSRSDYIRRNVSVVEKACLQKSW